MKKLIICICIVQACVFGFEASKDLALLPHDISGIFSAELRHVKDLRFVEELRKKAEHYTAVFKEMTDIKCKKTEQKKKDDNKHIGDGGAKIAGKFPLEYRPYAVHRLINSHKSPKI